MSGRCVDRACVVNVAIAEKEFVALREHLFWSRAA